MLEAAFEEFLLNDEDITSKEKAVATRMSKARVVEETLGSSLDIIVADDFSMYKALISVNNEMNNKSGAYSNALRKYYTFKNSKVFPKIDVYERENKKAY